MGKREPGSASIKFEKIPLFYPHCQAAPLWGIAPGPWLHLKCLLFISHERCLYLAGSCPEDTWNCSSCYEALTNLKVKTSG